MQNGHAKGEYRSLTPQEIAYAVQMFRKMMDWKQLTLAIEAGVNERTVQRIERGEKVGDETLHRIGKALRLQEPGFGGARYIPSEEELQAQVAKTMSELKVTEAHELTAVKDVDAVLSAHGYVWHENALPASLDDEIAALKDAVTDWGDCYEDISNVERLNACRSLLADVQKIETRGFKAYYGLYETDDRFRVAVLVFRPREEAKLTQLGVRRSFAQMARESLRA